MEKRMRAERRLGFLVRNLLGGFHDGRIFYLRFADVFFAVFEVAAEFSYVEPAAVGLGSHERESGLKDFVRKLFVMRAHAFPEIVDDVLNRDGAWCGSPLACDFRTV